MSSSASSVLAVRVRPGARQDGLDWDASRGWTVHVAAPPVDGAANARLARFLGRELLGIPASALRVRVGASGRTKLLEIDLPADEVEQRLRAALSGSPR